MKPFDIKDSCVKCNCKNIRTAYCPGPGAPVLCRETPAGHLHRNCSRCHHSWTMTAADGGATNAEIDLTE